MNYICSSRTVNIFHVMSLIIKDCVFEKKCFNIVDSDVFLNVGFVNSF